MLLAVDIGNSNVVVSAFEKDKILYQWRLETDAAISVDEYCEALGKDFEIAGMKAEDFTDAVLSSVVPTLISVFEAVVFKLTGKKPFVISGKLMLEKTFPVHCPPGVENQLGTDLICNAVRCKALFNGKSGIVVDFGTALSMIVTDKEGIIRGVSISPGLGTAMRSLWANTAQLPPVPLEVPETSLGLDTISAIQSGVVLGYKGLVEYLVQKLKEDLSKVTGDKIEDIKVAATGGLNKVLSPIIKSFDLIDNDLTVNGLRLIYEWYKKSGKD